MTQASKTGGPSVDEMVEKRRLLVIRWEDHWGSAGWQAESDHLTTENMEPYFCLSIGWEIGRNDKVVKLAQSLSESTRCADVITIMLSAVVSEEEITFDKSGA